MFFSELNKCYKEAQMELSIYPVDSAEHSLAEYKLRACNIIKEYIEKGEWCRDEKAFQRVMMAVKYGYEYAAAQTGTTVNSTKVAVTQMSKKLYRIIGDNTLQLIKDGKVDMALLQFQAGLGYFKYGNIACSNIKSKLPAPEFHAEYDLLDCVEELNFLKTYSSFEFERQLANLNKDKLAHCLSLLENSSSVATTERWFFVKAILEGWSMDELLNKIMASGLYKYKRGN